jgi:heme exporter protein D
MTLAEFFNMGGYAVYVWSSYGITLVVLLANVIVPVRHRRRLLDDIARAARRARKET